MRINLVLVIAATVLVLHTEAQQRPYFTQYIINNFIVNPAIAGIENYWDVKMSFRNQWVGLEGAPQSSYITIQGPLQQGNYVRKTATSIHFEHEGSPMGGTYLNKYDAAPAHAGIGATLISDKAGPISRLSATVTYAYHLGLSPDLNLSAGISAGIQQIKLDVTKLDFGIISPTDPVVSQGNNIDDMRADINAGLWLYSSSFFVGLAAQNIVPQKVDFNKSNQNINKEGKLIPHLYASLGTRSNIGPTLSILPSVLLKYNYADPLSFDINCKLQYLDFMWTGASYRFNDGLALMAGANINSTINIGYAYDITTSPLNTVSKGSHEIVVGFLLGNRYKDLCPKRVW